MGQDAGRVGRLTLQVVGQVMVADRAIFGLAGLVRVAQRDLLESHGLRPAAGLGLQVGQGAVDFAEIREIPLGLEDGSAAHQQLAGGSKRRSPSRGP